MKNKKNKIPEDFLDEILFKYKLNKWRKRLVNFRFENKVLNYVFNFFFYTSFFSALALFPFLIISLILYKANRNSDPITSYAISRLLLTALSMAIISIVFCLVFNILYKLNLNKKYVLVFNNWSMKKMIIGSNYKFNYIKVFDTAPSNFEIMLQKTDKKVWSLMKEKDPEYPFDPFIINTSNVSIHFKITTKNGIVFYLKQSTILSKKFQLIENENFLIIDSELINNEKKFELEKSNFKPFKEKEQKLYFYTPYNRFELFDIIVENSSYLKLKQKILEKLELKLKQLDEIAKIINN